MELQLLSSGSYADWKALLSALRVRDVYYRLDSVGTSLTDIRGIDANHAVVVKLPGTGGGTVPSLSTFQSDFPDAMKVGEFS